MATLKILVINANNRQGSKTNDRRKVTAEVVNEVKPDVIFLQEFDENDWKERNFYEELELVHDNNEAFVVTKLPLTAPISGIREVYAGTITEMTDQFRSLSLSKEAPKDYFDLSRLYCCVIDKRWLCVSWHGRNTSVPEESKYVTLKFLLEFLIRLQKEVGHPFILGTDLNMDSSLVRKVVSEVSSHGLKLFEADSTDEEKVMVIVSGEITADAGSIMHGEKDTPPNDRILDHLPLELTLRLPFIISCPREFTERLQKLIEELDLKEIVTRISSKKPNLVEALDVAHESCEVIQDKFWKINQVFLDPSRLSQFTIRTEQRTTEAQDTLSKMGGDKSTNWTDKREKKIIGTLEEYKEKLLDNTYRFVGNCFFEKLCGVSWMNDCYKNGVIPELSTL